VTLADSLQKFWIEDANGACLLGSVRKQVHRTWKFCVWRVCTGLDSVRGIYACGVAVVWNTVVTGILNWNNPSDRTMALGSTQPLTEMSTINISWGCKGGRCLGLTALPPSWNLAASVFWNSQDLSRPLLGLFYLYMFVIGCWFYIFRHFVSICGQPCHVSMSVSLSAPHCLLWPLVKVSCLLHRGSRHYQSDRLLAYYRKNSPHVTDYMRMTESVATNR
jgi:hypothetical protein